MNVTTPTTLVFYDDSASLIIGQGVLPTVPSGTSRPDGWRFNATWIAPLLAGDYYVRIIADYGMNVTEVNEENNAVELWLQVTVAGMPDYVPSNPQPPSPVRTGLGMTLDLSVQVENTGTEGATVSTTLAFFNGTSPGPIFSTTTVPPLNTGEVSGPYAATWTAPVMVGFFAVSTMADFASVLPEENESNNQYTWTIQVVEGPITTLVVGQPNYTVGGTYVTSSTPLDFAVIDQSGTGILRTLYTIDGGLPVNYTATGTFSLTGEGIHSMSWFSEDFAGNSEAANFGLVIVDDTPPAVSILVGAPNYTATDTWIAPSTSIDFTAVDGGIVPVGVDAVECRLWYGSWSPWSTLAGPFTLTGEGLHYVEYRATDLLGNAGAVRNATLIVDGMPPTTTIDVGDPMYQGDDLYVTSATQIGLLVTDGGVVPVGTDSAEYNVNDAGWIPYLTPFALTGADGLRTVTYRAVDLLGNLEAVQILLVVLDNTPPTTAPAIGDPKFFAAEIFVTSETPVTLNTTDGGAGVNRTLVRIWNGTWSAWSDYGGPLSLLGADGPRHMEYFSVDHLGNEE
ncbi:MAG: CARDB domain-containing protein, partial [Armatimonadota bacterium]